MTVCVSVRVSACMRERVRVCECVYVCVEEGVSVRMFVHM